MTDTEWQKIAREMGHQIANDIIASEKELHKKEIANEKIRLQHRTAGEIDLIKNGFERYRESTPDSTIRKTIDMLLHQHAHLVNPNDRYYRTRHNILILKYIVSQPMSDKEIQKRLGMSTSHHNSFENQLEKGIREIAALFFYDWDLFDM